MKMKLRYMIIFSILLVSLNQLFLTSDRVSADEDTEKEKVTDLSIDVSDDTYIEGGKNADTNFADDKWLKVKTTNSTADDKDNYMREAFMKFDISEIPVNTNHITLDIEVDEDTKGAKLGEDFSDVSIYTTETDWKENDVTWNDYPETSENQDPIILSRKEVLEADFKPSIDVTDAVIAARQEGETEIAFHFKVDGKANNNQFVMYSKESDEDRKSATLTISEIIYSKIDPVQVTTLAGYAPQLPSQVNAYVEGETDPTSVHVTWDDIDDSSYQSSGEFTVEGTIAKTDMKAQAHIKVIENYTGNTYYVDATNGNDDDDGLTPETAWKSMEKVNETTFLPSDKLLLKSGEIWNHPLKPQGSGIEGKPIIIDQYGDSTDRPIINGNGEGTAHFRGAVMLVDQDYWEINNLEVLNDDGTPKEDISHVRAGILMYTSDQNNIKNHIRIRDSYVHDVVSALDPGIYSNKMASGILLYAGYEDPYRNRVTEPANNKSGFNDVIIENNTVKDVMKEGIRTKVHGTPGDFNKNNDNIVIRNNYIADVFGDGIVLAEVASGGVVEQNIVQNPVNSNEDAVSPGSGWYAGAWVHFTDDAVFQYNEVSGAMYGRNDGEAFDADNESYNNTFQYNYTHNNNGGAMLFMSTQHNTTYRYNITANDGWRDGEEIFNDHSNDANNDRVPQIYNNTIYIGKDIDTNIYSGVGEGIYVNFRNNIVLSESTSEDTRFAKVPTREESVVENNLFWPEDVASENRLSKDRLLEDNNIFANPKLADTASVGAHDEDERDIVAFMDNPKQVLQDRVAIYRPTEGSPTAGKGIAIAENDLTTDIMDNPIQENPTIGAIEAPVVDKKALENLLNEAKEIKNKDKYTKDSFSVLTGEISSATEVLDDDQVTQAEIDKTVTSLKAAIDGLEERESENPKLDKKALEKLLNKAKNIENEGKYTKDSFSTLEKAITNAEKTMKDDEASQSDIDKVLNQLQQAIESLEKSEIDKDNSKIDKEELKNKLEEAQSINNNGLYTEDSFETLKSEIAKAEKVLRDESVTQTEINTTVKKLQNAIKSLKKTDDKSTGSGVANNQSSSNNEGDIPSKDDGEKLPVTATNMYTLLLVGAVLLAAGIIFIYIRKRKET